MVSALKPGEFLERGDGRVVDLAVVDVDDLEVGHVLQELQESLSPDHFLRMLTVAVSLPSFALSTVTIAPSFSSSSVTTLSFSVGDFLLQRRDLRLELGRIVGVCWRVRGWLGLGFLLGLGLGFLLGLGLGFLLGLGLGFLLGLGLGFLPSVLASAFFSVLASAFFSVLASAFFSVLASAFFWSWPRLSSRSWPRLSSRSWPRPLVFPVR